MLIFDRCCLQNIENVEFIACLWSLSSFCLLLIESKEKKKRELDTKKTQKTQKNSIIKKSFLEENPLSKMTLNKQFNSTLSLYRLFRKLRILKASLYPSHVELFIHKWFRRALDKKRW